MSDQRQETRRPDRLKAGDGLVSLPQCARIAGVPETTLHNWVVGSLIEPTEAAGFRPGPGNHRRFNLRDLTAICVVAKLREHGVHVRALRKIQSELRAWSKDFATARLMLVENSENEVVDVAILRTESAWKTRVFSVHKSPGQSIIAELELAPVARRARSEFRSALKEEPAIRGRRPAKRRTLETKAATG